MVRATVGIYEAKNKLSELLDRVEAGEIIAVTRHGKQVALITPVHQERGSAGKPSSASGHFGPGRGSTV